MSRRKAFGLVVLGLALGLGLAAGPAAGQGKKSGAVVKAQAEGGKVGPDGKQVVTITLTVSPKFHIYANPVGNEDFSSNETSVTFTGKSKPAEVKVEYPAGEVKKDKILGDYRIYKGKVTLKATVTRARGDTEPLTAVIKVQACDDTRCLEPSKITVPVK